MKSLLRSAVVSLCVAAVLSTAGKAQQRAAGEPPAPSDFSLLTNRIPATSLVGQWRFHPGDDPAWAGPQFDDSKWQLLASDKSWNEQGYPDLSGFAWYRFTVEEPCDGKRYSVVLPVIRSTYKVFVDGKLVAAEGPDRGRWSTQPLQVDLPVQQCTASRRIGIALRVWHGSDFRDGGGPADGNHSLLAEAHIAQKEIRFSYLNQWRRYATVVPLTTLSLLACFISFFLYAQSRRETEYLWFGIYNVLVFAGYVLELREVGRVVNSDLFNDLENFCAFAAIAALIVFYRQLLHARTSILFWFAVACQFLVAPWQILTEVLHIPVWRDVAWAVVGLMFPIWIVTTLVRDRKERRIDVLLAIAPALLWILFTEYMYAAFRLFPILLASSRFIVDVHIGMFPIGIPDLTAALLTLAVVPILVRRSFQSRRQQFEAENDLHEASAVQHLLIPDMLTPLGRYRVEAAYLPAREVSGDFFQVLDLDGEEVLIVVGDVAGKGMSAALTVSVLVGAVRATARQVPPPLSFSPY